MIGGTLPAGGGPTITVSPRTWLPACSVSSAVPAVPVVIVSVAVCEPARTTTAPSTVATAGSLLVTVTGVSTVAGVGSSGTVSVCWPLVGVMSCPSDWGLSTVTSTGSATIGGTVPAGGGPTITVSPRTSVPARSVSNAVPAVPVVTVSVAASEPARTTTAPSTVATAGSLLVTVTGVSIVAGVGNSGTVSVCWPLAGASSRPRERGSWATSPTAGASTLTVCCETGSLTETIAPARPRLEVAMTVVFPTAAPVIATRCSV